MCFLLSFIVLPSQKARLLAREVASQAKGKRKLPSQKVRLLMSQAASQACMNAWHRRLYGDSI